MCRGRQADEQRGHPEIGDARGRKHRHDAYRADQHSRLAGGIHRPAPLDEPRREPAAADTAHIGNQVNNHQRRAQLHQIQSVLLVQESRNPVKIEPPYRPTQEHPYDECPRLAIAQQRQPGNLNNGVRRVAADIGQFSRRKAWMFFGASVKQPPGHQPHQAQCARYQERHRPAEGDRQPGTSNGAATAPTLLPALKMPVASARSFLGNHSLTVLIAAGKFPPSANPSAKRAALKPSTVTGITSSQPWVACEAHGQPIAQFCSGRDEPVQGVCHLRQAPE